MARNERCEAIPALPALPQRLLNVLHLPHDLQGLEDLQVTWGTKSHGSRWACDVRSGLGVQVRQFSKVQARHAAQ